MANWKMHHEPGNVVDGKKIRRLREAKGWTQEQLAHRCDMTAQNIGRIEMGDGNTSTGKVRSMADTLGVEPAALIIGVDELIAEAVGSLKEQPVYQLVMPDPEPVVHRDVVLLRAFAGNNPAFLNIGTLKTDIPEEILGEILHIVAVHKMTTGGKQE